MNGRRCLVLLSVCMSTVVHAAAPERLDLTRIPQESRWKTSGGRKVTVTEVKGKLALRISEGDGMGLVWLDGYDFANGVIDIDLLGRSQPVQGSFVGVAFHVADANTHEVVYFRPFNFEAADPVRHSHAVQYASHPQWPWETLREKHPGVYEHALTGKVDGDAWFHARVVVQRPKVSVFVNGSSEATLEVNELGTATHGSIGLWVGEGSGGAFANLEVERQP